LPLVFTHGASALGNHSIGVSAIGGMLTGVLLGVFIIPVLFVIFQYLQEKVQRRPVVDKHLPDAELATATVHN